MITFIIINYIVFFYTKNFYEHSAYGFIRMNFDDIQKANDSYINVPYNHTCLCIVFWLKQTKKKHEFFFINVFLY